MGANSPGSTSASALAGRGQRQSQAGGGSKGAKDAMSLQNPSGQLQFPGSGQFSPQMKMGDSQFSTPGIQPQFDMSKIAQGGIGGNGRFAPSSGSNMNPMSLQNPSGQMSMPGATSPMSLSGDPRMMRIAQMLKMFGGGLS
jgi:hypothetical protein